MDYTLEFFGIYPNDIKHAVEVADMACEQVGVTADDLDRAFDAEDIIFDLKCTGSWDNITNSVILSYFSACASAVENKLGSDNVRIDWFVNGYDSDFNIEVLEKKPSGKRALLIDYVDNMDGMDQYGLWNECAHERRIDPIYYFDCLDEDFKPSDVLKFDLSRFNYDYNFYVIDEDYLISYEFFDEAMDDMGQKDELIDWLMEGYDGFYDELTDFMHSEEYLQAEDN